MIGILELTDMEYHDNINQYSDRGKICVVFDNVKCYRREEIFGVTEIFFIDGRHIVVRESLEEIGNRLVRMCNVG